MRKFVTVLFLSFFCIPAFCATFNSSADNVVISFHFNETSGSTAFSAGGRARSDATLTGNTTFVTGKIGGGVSFDGTADRITTLSSSSAWGFTNAYTVIAWVRHNKAGSGDGTVVCSSENVDPVTKGWSVHFNAGGFMAVCHWTVACEASGFPISTGTWQRLGWVYDGTRVYYYQDGEQKDSDILSNAVGNAGNLKIGDQLTLTDMYGEIDELIIYERALSRSEMKNDYIQFFGNKKYANDF